MKFFIFLFLSFEWRLREILRKVNLNIRNINRKINAPVVTFFKIGSFAVLIIMFWGSTGGSSFSTSLEATASIFPMVTPSFLTSMYPRTSLFLPELLCFLKYVVQFHNHFSWIVGQQAFESLRRCQYCCTTISPVLSSCFAASKGIFASIFDKSLHKLVYKWIGICLGRLSGLPYKSRCRRICFPAAFSSAGARLTVHHQNSMPSSPPA